MNRDAEDTLVATMRDEWPQLVAVAMRILGDLQAAEDVVQETLVTALDRWPLLGVPERPCAWLVTACRNRARNAVRDAERKRMQARAAETFLRAADEPTATPEEPAIADDRLRLMVLCCHPLLPTDAQIALTLRIVAGLTTEEIARGFNESVSAVAQRIVRAKRTLKEHRVSFARDEADLPARLPSVLDVLYLVFNEGYLVSAGPSLTRGDLAFEAHRLSALLTELAPEEGEVWAMHALLGFQLSRWATRIDEDGALVPLDRQDRKRWDQQLVTVAWAALERARESEPRTPLMLQAELAACHATARSYDLTDWPRILGLYDELLQIQRTPVVALNRAVAVAMVDGAAAALPMLDELVEDPSLRETHRAWSVRAELHRRDGRLEAAIADYDKALELVTNDVERRYLEDSRHKLAPSP